MFCFRLLTSTQSSRIELGGRDIPAEKWRDKGLSRIDAAYKEQEGRVPVDRVFADKIGALPMHLRGDRCALEPHNTLTSIPIQYYTEAKRRSHEKA